MCSKTYVLRIVCSESCAVLDEYIKIRKMNEHIYSCLYNGEWQSQNLNSDLFEHGACILEAEL